MTILIKSCDAFRFLSRAGLELTILVKSHDEPPHDTATLEWSIITCYQHAVVAFRVHLHYGESENSGGSRISQMRALIPKGGGTNLLFGQFFPANCVKMKEIRPKGAAKRHHF